MTVQRQMAEIPLGGGLEGKVDEKLVPPGRSLVVENMEFAKAGAANKRNGYTALTLNKLGGGTLDNARGLFVRDTELVVVDKKDFYAYSETAAKWVRKTGANAPAWQCTTRETRLPSAASTGHQCDFAYCNGYAVFAYRVANASGVYSIRVTVTDTATGAVIIASAETGLTATYAPRVIASDTVVFIVAANGSGDIYATYFDTASVSSTLPTAYSIANDSGGNYSFDLGSYGDGTAVLAYTNTSPRLAARSFDTSTSSAATEIISEQPASQIGVVVTAAGEVFFAMKSSANNVRCRATSADFSTPLFATVTIEAAATADHIVGTEVSADVVVWCYNTLEAGTASSAYRNIRSARINNAGSVTLAAATVVRNHHVLTRPWVYDGQLFLGVYYAGATVGASTTVQPTYFVWALNSSNLPATGACVAKLMTFNGVDEDSLTGTPNLRPSSVAAISSGVYWFGGAGTFGGLMAPARLEIDFSHAPSGAQLGSSLFISGGMPLEYDGVDVVEHNFNVYPEIVGTGSSAVNGSLSDGTYQVAAVFCYIDGNGRVHRSAPSVTTTVVLSGGTATQRIFVYVASGWSSRRSTSVSGARIEAYVTEAGGTTLYFSATAANDTTAAENTVTVTSVDTSARIIYTNGGVLENATSPALVSVVAKGKRLYGATRDGVVWYTKELVDGEGAAYVQDTTILALPRVGTETFSLGVMDTLLVAIGEKTLCVVSGEGLNDTGSVNTLGEPRDVPTALGAASGTPVAVTPHGVFYKSKNGIALVDRSFNTSLVGAPADDYKDLTTVAAVVVPDKNQVRFGHSDGSTLVFDYLLNQWTVFTGFTQVGAILYDNTYCFVTSAGQVNQEDAAFLDGAAAISLAIETPWIRIAGAGGFQRAGYIGILGEWRSAHTLTARIYLDHSPTAVETITWDLSTGYSANDPLHVRHRVGRKCRAIKVRIEDSSQAGTKESLTLAALQLEIGAKGGVFRLGTASTA